MHDFAITAADAMTAGGSSIAVVVDHADGDVHALRSVARGGDGTAGMSGGMQAAQAEGVSGRCRGNDREVDGGGAGATRRAPAPGGNGGNGGLAPNGNGQDGQPGDNGNGGPRVRGYGFRMRGWDERLQRREGPSGTVPPGIGTIDASGYHGVDGNDDAQDGTTARAGAGAAVDGDHDRARGRRRRRRRGRLRGQARDAGHGGWKQHRARERGREGTLAGCTLGAGNAGNGGAGGDGQFGQLGGALGTGGNVGWVPAPRALEARAATAATAVMAAVGAGGTRSGSRRRGRRPCSTRRRAQDLRSARRGAGAGRQQDADMNHGGDGVAAACWDFAANAACK